MIRRATVTVFTPEVAPEGRAVLEALNGFMTRQSLAGRGSKA
ncbi:MAG TPA: hypothetical protein VGK27_03570 [Candidatus Deferrimicrobiaceae bacterium]|jgi:hypothetical protein